MSQVIMNVLLKFGVIEIDLDTVQRKGVAFRELNHFFSDRIIKLNFNPKKGYLIDINKLCDNEFPYIDLLIISEIVIESSEYLTLILSSPSDYVKIKDTY